MRTNRKEAGLKLRNISVRTLWMTFKWILNCLDKFYWYEILFKMMNYAFCLNSVVSTGQEYSIFLFYQTPQIFEYMTSQWCWPYMIKKHLFVEFKTRCWCEGNILVICRHLTFTMSLWTSPRPFIPTENVSIFFRIKTFLHLVNSSIMFRRLIAQILIRAWN